MPMDAEITFADHAGRLYARRYGFPPVVGRLFGYLAICDPRDQGITELADALRASRSAITSAARQLEMAHLVQRSRAAGERMDKVRVDLTSPQALGFDITEYVDQRNLALAGLEVLKDELMERRAVLLHWAAFAEFLAEHLPALEKQWKEHRAALVRAGRLPDESTL